MGLFTKSYGVVIQGRVVSPSIDVLIAEVLECISPVLIDDLCKADEGIQDRTAGESAQVHDCRQQSNYHDQRKRYFLNPERPSQFG